MSALFSHLRRAWARVRALPRSTQVLAGLALAVLLAAGLWLLLQLLPREPDETWDTILATGLVRVCTDPSWPPFEMVDERTGQMSGLDVELAGLLAGRLAPGMPIRAEMVSVAFDSLYDALIAGRCDAVLSALPYEAERTRDVSYSPSYFNAGQVIVVRDGTADISTAEDLPAHEVGVEWGWVPEGETRQRLLLQTLRVKRYDTATDVLRALQAGEIEVGLVDHISALSFAHDCGGVTIAGEPLTDVSYIIPVRIYSWRLLEEIERVLEEMKEDGTIDGLVEKWF
jgi:ABC-type amino acid transport substrate-binding protein